MSDASPCPWSAWIEGNPGVDIPTQKVMWLWLRRNRRDVYDASLKEFNLVLAR